MIELIVQIVAKATLKEYYNERGETEHTMNSHKVRIPLTIKSKIIKTSRISAGYDFCKFLFIEHFYPRELDKNSIDLQADTVQMKQQKRDDSSIIPSSGPDGAQDRFVPQK